MTSRGERTREHLLDVAERMFAERGFQGVSLREIRIAAGARNTAAIQFHFGDRAGLVGALIDRHMPRIGAHQEELFDRMVAEGRESDTRSLVEVLVRPSAEYLTQGPSERAWVIIMAELSALPELRGAQMRDVAPRPAVTVGGILFDDLRSRMPTVVAVRRMVLLAQSAVQLAAVRARAEPRHRPPQVLPLGVFVENLVDMIHGALFAPVSEATTLQLEIETRIASER